MRSDVKQTALNFALSYACRAGNYDVAEYALGLGADVNYGRGFTLCPLHGALWWFTEDDHDERLRIVMLLLQSGADPNIRNREGCTPLYDAVRRDVPAAVKVLVGWGADTTDTDGTGRGLLEVATAMGKRDIVEMIEGRELDAVVQ
jgi:uncharacterized protein